jgi:hypothetical protein
VVLNRNTGSAIGGWVTLASGPHTLQVDWTSGSTGTLKLSVDGTSQPTLSGSNSNLRIETAWLGLSNGTSSNTSKAYFDSFASTRFTMP